MNIYPDFITKMTWGKCFTIGNQELNFSPTKVLINIPAHIFFGFIFFSIYYFIFGNLYAFLTCLGIFGFFQGGQIFHENIKIKEYDGILMNILDLIEYLIFPVILFILL